VIEFDVAARVLEGRWLSQGKGCIRGGSIDTRTLEPGQAFFALPGEHVDGHDFVEQAAARGASIAIVDRDIALPTDLPVLLVASVRDALWTLSAHYRVSLPSRVVAVMGSNGKTTSVRMLHAVLSTAMRTQASARSFNNALGLPLTILNTPMDAEALVCELGEGEPGALARYASLARPDLAIITSVGRAHVGELGGVSAVRREFEQALEILPPHAKVFVPATEPTLVRASVTTFAAPDARHEDGRVAFELPDGTRWRLPVAGTHNASNAAAVVAACRALGVSDAAIAEGLAAFEPAAMRLTVREFGGARVLVDCYNANPDSVAAALHTLKELAQESPHAGIRTIAVIGDMLELGEDSAKWHLDAMRHALDVADACVFIGPSFATVCDGSESAWFNSVDDARSYVASLLDPGTLMLLKGSRGLALEGLLEGLGESAVA